MRQVLSCLTMLCALTGILFGQSSSADTGEISLPDGSTVRLALLNAISSAEVKTGDKVELVVVDEVRVGNLVVIARKAQATGIVKDLRPPGRMWKDAVLGIEGASVRLLNDEQAPLQAGGNLTGPGIGVNAAESMTAASSDLPGGALFLPLFLLHHGRDVVIPRGSVITAATKGDVLLNRDQIKKLQPHLVSPASGPASVTFYFSSARKGIQESGGYSGPAELWCGTVKLAILRPGRRLTTNLVPGTYWIRSHHGIYDKKKHLLQLKVQEGGAYYVFVGNFPNGLPGKLELVDSVVGELETEGTVPVAGNDRQDISTALQQKLQAEVR